MTKTKLLPIATSYPVGKRNSKQKKSPKKETFDLNVKKTGRIFAFVRKGAFLAEEQRVCLMLRYEGSLGLGWGWGGMQW